MQECWAKLQGSVRHKRGGKSIRGIPIEIRAHLTVDEIVAQIVFNHQERYLATQRFIGGEGSGTVILQRDTDDNRVRARDVGLRPDDITLSFLYWNFDHEYPEEKVRGQDCRVVRLRNPLVSDFVKVWISKKYVFPLKVEWSRTMDSGHYRTLEFSGFAKIKDAWIIKELKIRGPEWKTIVKLKDNIVESVTPNKSIPDDLFFSD